MVEQHQSRQFTNVAFLGERRNTPSSLLVDESHALDAGRQTCLPVDSVRSGVAFGTGRTYVLPLAKGSVLPAIPDGGFRDEQQLAAAPGVEILPYGDVTLASAPGVYAFSRVTT